MKNLTKSLLTLLLGLLIVVSQPLFAKPVGSAAEDGLVITLFDDSCELSSKVSNLPYKALWLENGKQIKGCFGLRPDHGLVVAYFEDGSVALIPMALFKPVTEI